MTAPQQVAVSETRAKSALAQVAQRKSPGGAGEAESELLHHRRAGHRNRRQEDRGDRAKTFRPGSS